MSEKSKKALNVLIKIVAYLLVAFTVFIMIFTIFSVTTVDKNDRSVLGLRFYVVLTDSMSKSDKNADMDVHFNAGDIIFVKNVKDKTKLEAGDIIAFMSSNPESYGETITHMIREVKTTDDGKILGYVTFGTNTDTNDEALVEPAYVLGKYTGKLPGVGYFFEYLRSPVGYVIFILIPFILLILYNGINAIRLFRRYKKEQNAALEAERAELAEERKQNAEMLRELMALKEQLAKQNGEGNAPSETQNSSETTEDNSENN